MKQGAVKNIFKKAASAVLAGTVLFSLAACGGTKAPAENSSSADSGDKLKVAIVQHVDHPSLNEIRETIKSEFEKNGMMDKIEIIEKNANGDSTLLPSIMQSLVSDGVDMIIPIATPTAQAALAATSQIPIVFSAVSNPVEAGIVEAFDKTDKNVTGVSNSIAIEDIFALAAELTPEAKTFGFVYNPGEVNSLTGIERARAYCDEHGLSYKEATIASAADVQQAASSLVGSVDAFFTPNDNMVASAMPAYTNVVDNAKLPLYVGADSMVKDGGLATVGIDYTVLGRQTAQMAERILNGESIADNHVEAIKEYAKMINTDVASNLGIEIPESIKAEFKEIKTEN